MALWSRVIRSAQDPALPGRGARTGTGRGSGVLVYGGACIFEASNRLAPVGSGSRCHGV